MQWPHKILNTGKSEWLISFYGFEQNQESILNSPLKNRFNIICFDLPYHGDHWDEGIQMEHLFSTTDRLLEENNIRTCFIFGFSIGTRLAMLTCQHVQLKAEAVLLSAPDGLVNYGKLKRALRNPMAKKVLFKVINTPKTMDFLLNISKKIALLSLKDIHYLQNLSNQDHKLKKMYKLWSFMSEESLSPKKFQTLIDQKKIKTTIFHSNQDTIVRSRKLEKKAPASANLIDLKTHHNALFLRSIQYITSNIEV